MIRSMALLTAAVVAALSFGAITASAAHARAVRDRFGKTPTIVGTDAAETILGAAGDDVVVGLGAPT
jgi:hypothetical protein